MKGLIEVYGNARMAALVGIGFASGLPYILATDTIAAWLSSLSIDVTTIGLFSLIMLPYGLKFMWAPLMDRLLPPGLRGLGRRKAWLLLAQILISCTLAGIAVWGPHLAGDDLTPLAVLGIALVLFSASQDVVADAYRADIVQQNEFGAGAATFVSGYRVAMIVGGALALEMVGPFGWRGAFGVMAAFSVTPCVVTLLAPKPADPVTAPQTLSQAVRLPVLQFASVLGWRALLVGTFVLVFALPDRLAARMTMPLLIDHLQFDPQDIGRIRQLLGFSITIVGALAAGGMIARGGPKRWLLAFGLLQALSNAGFCVLAASDQNRLLMAAVIVVESFCSGLVGTGFVAYLMSLCDRAYSATQYALLSGLIALSASAGGALSGYLANWLGYEAFFAATILAAAPGMAMIPWLPDRTKTDDGSAG